MRNKAPQLTLALAAVLTVVALSLLPDSDVAARTLVALPLSMVLPGYAVIDAAFSHDALGTAERIALSLGLSLLLGVVGGVVLDWTPWGLRAGSWIVLLGGVTIGACLYALAWPHADADGDEGGASLVARAEHQSFAGSRARLVRDGVLLALAAGIAAGAAWVATDGAQVRREGFSELWLLPLDDSQRTVQVGLRSEELASTEYTVRLVADGTTVLRSDQVRLEPGGQWEATVDVAASETVSEVEALVYRADDPTQPYRRAHLRPGGPPVQSGANS